MRVGILTVQVPFIRGGAELHAENLRTAIRAAGHEAEIVTMPFKWYPAEAIPQQMLGWRLVDLEESCGAPIDRVIGLKFPAYLAPHPNKVLWILHQHRGAYDLWNKPFGDLHWSDHGRPVAEAIRQADSTLIPEARAVWTNSRNVSDRLRHYCGLDGTPLYHPPPHAERYAWAEDGDFLLMPSRINALKRQDLALEALRRTRSPVKLAFMGAPDDAGYADRVREASRSVPDGRVRWLGSVSDSEKLRLYGSCLGVVFPPVDEDYGYITLEAMLSEKPVITCTDSGGPNEFVLHDQTGLVCPPEPDALAEAMDRLWNDRARTRAMGRAARAHYAEMALSWDHVVQCLLA